MFARLVGFLAASLASACMTMAQPTPSMHCYIFENRSSATVKLAFRYNTPVNSPVIGATLSPGSRFPQKDPWCWHTPSGVTATVDITITGGPAENGWSGPLLLGNGPTTSPSGTYTFITPQSPPIPGGRVPGGGILNSYPGNENFILTFASNGLRTTCATYNNSGTLAGRTYDLVHLRITCKDGRKWNLSCVADGSLCNLSDSQLCYGLTQKNVGQHCTTPGKPNDGWSK